MIYVCVSVSQKKFSVCSCKRETEIERWSAECMYWLPETLGINKFNCSAKEEVERQAKEKAQTRERCSNAQRR